MTKGWCLAVSNSKFFAKNQSLKECILTVHCFLVFHPVELYAVELLITKKLYLAIITPSFAPFCN